MNAYDRQRLEQRKGTSVKILLSAISLFGQRGYEKTTLKDVADLVGVTHVLVLKYFDTKENLLYEAYQYAVMLSYPLPEGELILREWVELLIKQSIHVMKTKPEIFDFFLMLLSTSDLPETYHAAKREFFYQAPIYPIMNAWQKQRELPEGDLREYFMTFMRTVYTILDFHRKMSKVKNGEMINADVLLSYIINQIDNDMKER